MATVYSGWVAQDDYRVRLDYSVSYPNATQAIVTMTAYIDAKYGSIGGWTMYADISCDGQSRQLSRSGFSAWTLTNMGTVSFTVNRSSSARNVGVSCRIYCPSAGGSYASGATASGTASISGISYSAPAAPSGCAASRASDSQAKVTWSNGATGTTTPRSAVLVERQTDSGGWSQVASLGASATNWTDNSISADHRYAYRVRSQGAGGYSGYSTSGYIYTTPASPSSVTATKTGAQSVQLEIAGAAAWAESYGLERTADGGSTWQACGTATSFPWVDPSAPAGTVRYRVRAVRGDLASAWAESNSVTTITPPLAPSLSGLPAVAATGTALSVSWVPNHPDGSEQTQAQVEYQVGAAASVTADVPGAATSYSLPASATASAGTVKVRVRTHGLDEDWGAWSAWVSVRVAVAPQAHFTSPAVDGATVAALPLAVAWEAVDATGISSQTLQLLGADGSVLLTRQLAGDARSLRIDDSVYALSNLTGYTLRLTVLGGSSLSATTQRSFSTDWAQPSDPGADVRVDPSDLSCAVTVLAGEGEGAEAAVAEVPEGKTAGGAVVYGSTRQNLWVNPTTVTSHGITLTSNPDGTVTVGGTSDAAAYINAGTYRLVAGAAYTLSVDRAAAGARGFYIVVYDGSGAAVQTVYVGGSISSETESSFVAASSGVKAVCGFGVDAGETVSGTYRVMLNEGDAADPWCPPGLSSVDELSIVTSGRNLFGGSFPPANSILNLGWLPAGDYTISMLSNEAWWETATNGKRIYFYKGNIPSFLMQDTEVGQRCYGTFTNPVGQELALTDFSDGIWTRCSDFQLEPGTVATEYESGREVTEFPVDLDGNQLCSLPDGTRDELHIGPDGSCRIVKRTWTQTVTGDNLQGDYSSNTKYHTVFGAALQHDQGIGNSWNLGGALGDVLPPIDTAFVSSSLGFSGTAYQGAGSNIYVNAPGATFDECRAWLNSHPLTVVYKLAEPVEVELPPVSLSLAGPGLMWADAPVPAAARPVHMLGSSFSVVRVLADGSQWLVADGLTDGQQAIDPLPPLNVPFSYLVTAYAETGVSSAAGEAVTVDAPGKYAYNFGSAAEVCEVLEYDASVSESFTLAGTAYHFADGGAGGGLPVFYGLGDLDVSGSDSFSTLDHAQFLRLRDIARRYPLGWFRDAEGNRSRCYISFKLGSSGTSHAYSVGASRTELRFEEAW